MEQVVSKVEKQEVEISYIKKTLDEIVEQNKKQNTQLSKISESIQKQEIILEKITNLEEKYSDSIKRLHNRIDDELRRCKEKLGEHKKEIDELKVQVVNRPCVTHNKIETELNYIKEKQNRHAQIFWWSSTLIIGAVIIALIKSIIK